MNQILLYPVGTTDACLYAAACLQQSGISLTDHPAPEVTHLLLDVPSFRPDGTLRDGTDPARILERVPESVAVIGGKLDLPLLKHHPVIDLLQQENYLAKNASITADCALRLAAPHLDCTLSDAPVLIIGWGRIGKCLGSLLKRLEVPVTVAARKEADRSMLRALGYDSIAPSGIPSCLSRFRILFNTVPSPVLGERIASQYPDIQMIDLASRPGILGSHVIQAQGLPGRYAPKTSGRLIADTILQSL